MHVTGEEAIRKVWDQSRMVEERKEKGCEWVEWVVSLQACAHVGNILKYNGNTMVQCTSSQ